MASDTKLRVEIVGADSVSRVVAELYEKYGSWLFAMIRRSGSGNAAEDIVQETFLRLLLILNRDKTVMHPQQYLLSIARNIQADRFRFNDRRAKPGFLLGLSAPHPTVAEGTQFETVYMKQIISSLPPLCRDVFLLSRFGGMPYEEIAALRKLSVKTVERRMSQALALCAASLRA